MITKTGKNGQKYVMFKASASRALLNDRSCSAQGRVDLREDEHGP
jgi:hypothetical protein